MKRIALLAVLAGAFLAVPAPASAQTTYLQQDDTKCGFVSTTDPSWSGAQTGELHGGPLVAGVDTPGSLGATIQLQCTIQVGWFNATHNGSDAAVATSAPSVQAATLSSLVSYWHPAPGDSVFLCTAVVVNGQTYYWDSMYEFWSLSSATYCREAISQEQVWVVPQCRDGLDNDVDGYTDHSGGDSDCDSPDDPLEVGAPNPLAPQCSDRLDNDDDNATDYPNDSDCTDPNDATEGPTPGSDPCPPTAPDVVICLTPGSVILERPVELVAVGAGTPHTVTGYVYAYHFEVAPGTEVSVPCVVLLLDGVERDPCLEAGGDREDLVFTLGPQTVDEPTAVPGGTVATVRVCNATLRATVGPFGVQTAPAFALC